MATDSLTSAGTGWAWYDEPGQWTWLGIERSQVPFFRSVPVTSNTNLDPTMYYFVMDYPANSVRIDGIPTPDPNLALPEGF